MSTPSLPIENFSYAYLIGPRESEKELLLPVSEGNCRLAIQLYFYRVHGVFLDKDKIYLPGGYKHLGAFVYEETHIDYNRLLPGDVIYAQNLKNKHGEPLLRNLDNYGSKDEWLYHLHSALYVGSVDGRHYIWHATSIASGTCVWSLEKFEEYYQPVSVKRLLGVDSLAVKNFLSMV